jgi:Flp pilus assembly protein protease CpaA
MSETKKNHLLPYTVIPLIVALYLALHYKTDDVMTILRSVTLISFGYIAAYLDFRIRKVPNKLVLAMLSVWVVIMSGYIILDVESAVTLLIQSLIGGAAAGFFFMMIYLVSRKGIGGGDVKLIAVMGLFMTLAKLMPMLFFSSLLTSVVSAVLLLTKRATMKTAIPLVPFLYFGTLLVIFM